MCVPTSALSRLFTKEKAHALSHATQVRMALLGRALFDKRIRPNTVPDLLHGGVDLSTYLYCLALEQLFGLNHT